MTIAELIAELQTIDQTLPVYVVDPNEKLTGGGELVAARLQKFDHDDGPDVPRFVVISKAKG